MAGTVSFPNIGSNIDVQSIINAYVSAEGANKTQMQQRVKDLQTAATSVSSVSTALSSLSSAISDLSDYRSVQTYTATSSGSEVAASVTGNAQGGNYSIDVVDTAKEYRAYSATLGTSASDPANLSGVLRIAVGDSNTADVTISGSDSIANIVSKINSTGLRVAASTFYDGSNYRIQLRGLDTGAANEVTTSGIDLGFSDAGNAIQQATDAHIKVDNIDVYSPTNQITGAIEGVTLAATAKTSAPVTLSIAADPKGLVDKVQSLVSSYNAVVSKVHTIAGYGTTAASVSSLAGDSTLRSLTDRLSSTLLTQVSTGTTKNTLAAIGISLQKDGTLALNSGTLTAAVASDSSSVVSVLAGSASSKGVMDLLSDLTKTFSEAGSGVLSRKVDSLNQQVSTWNKNIDREQARIDNYTTLLQKQFSAMTTSITSSQAMGNYLTSVLGGSSSSTNTTASTSK